MRISLVTRIFAPEPSAASLRLGSVVEALASKGVRVRVLTTRPPSRNRVTPHIPARVSRWPVLRDKSGYVRGYVQYMSFDIPVFFRVLFQRSVDAVVVEPPPTTGLFVRLASALRRTPYIYIAADIWSDAAGSTGAATWIVSGVRVIERFALRGATRVIAVSDGVANRVKALAPAARVTVVGHGVDTGIFTPDGEIPAAPADIVYVGTASEWHGASVAMEAVVSVLERTPNATAVFIGQGSQWSELRSIAERSSVASRIRLMSSVPPAHAAEWLRAARASVATLKPGLGYDFAVPTKIYSSLAAGTPVAYAGPDPVRAMIAENGLGAATEYDADSLAEALAKLIDGGMGLSPESLRTWTQDNVSAVAVAHRTVSAIMETVHDGE